MEPSRFLFVTLFVLGSLLIGCVQPEATPEPIPTDTPAPEVAPPTETATEVPPTPIPTDTATLVPPTSTPTEEPIPKPSPSRTPVTYGTFRGCTYYNGKLVAGSFKIGENRNDVLEARSGCASVGLPVGMHSINASSTEGECRPREFGGDFCQILGVQVEIFPDKVTEVDFHLEAPDQDD